MIYLAQPYSDQNKAIMERRYQQGMEAVARIVDQKHIIYSPIVHCHAVAVKYKLPRDADWWMAYNLEFLRLADEMWILRLEGWECSRGVNAEIIAAEAMQKPIRHVDCTNNFVIISDPVPRPHPFQLG